MKDLKSLFANEMAGLGDENIRSFDSSTVYAAGDEWNANAGAGQKLQPAKPMIMTITETGGVADATNVTFLDVLTNEGSATPITSTGGSCTITYDVPNMTYAMFLRSLYNMKPIIRQIKVISNTAGNLNRVLTVRSYNITGSAFEDTFTFEKNLYQQDNTGVGVDCEIPVLDSTRFILDRITLSTNLTMRLYPWITANRLAGIEQGHKFSNPGFNAAPVATPPPTPRSLM